MNPNPSIEATISERDSLKDWVHYLAGKPLDELATLVSTENIDLLSLHVSRRSAVVAVRASEK